LGDFLSKPSTLSRLLSFRLLKLHSNEVTVLSYARFRGRLSFCPLIVSSIIYLISSTLFLIQTSRLFEPMLAKLTLKPFILLYRLL
jgi:hypothetical protein